MAKTALSHAFKNTEKNRFSTLKTLENRHF